MATMETDFASMDSLFPDGPSLHDFVSTDPSSLPSFDPATSHGMSADNIIDYCIYVDRDKNTCDNVEALLQSVKFKVMTLVDTICGPQGLAHIWHQDRFQLRVQSETKQEEAHLTGSVCFGDCIDDEWLIVWLLSEATRLDDALSITLRDNDGEFLLIETSPSWPRSLNWLDPDTSHNRVWLRGGSFHIIADNAEEETDTSLVLSKALEILRRGVTIDKKSTTIHRGDRVKVGGLTGRSELNGQVGKCIGASQDRFVVEMVVVSRENQREGKPLHVTERLKVKPQNLFKITSSEAPSQVVEAFQTKLQAVQQVLKTNKQVVKMILPMEIAFILHETPHVVSAAIQLLYSRGPDEISSASKGHRFSKRKTLTKGQTLVEVSVRLTRCLLAMLNSQESFHPPKRMVTDWSTQLAVKSTSSGKPHEQTSAEMSALLEASPFKRGLLLTSAFEMLYQRHQSAQDSGMNGAQVMDATIGKHCCEECLGNVPSSSVVLKEDCCFCSDLAWLERMSSQRVDDESWMNVTPDELEAILQKASPPPIVNPNQEGDNTNPTEDATEAMSSFNNNDDDGMSGDGVKRLGKIVDGIHSFINKSSDIMGVELRTEKDEVEAISFDVNKFMSALQGKPYKSTDDENDIWGDPKNSDESDVDESEEENSDEGDGIGMDIGSTENKEDQEDEDDENEEEGEEEEEFKGYSEAMEKELDEGVLSESFEREGRGEAADNEPPSNEAVEEEVKPVDIDGNLVKHLLESYASQEGLAGPASNLLHEMGLFFPKTSQQKKSSEDVQGGRSNQQAFFTDEFIGAQGNVAQLPLGEVDSMYQLD